MYLKKVKIFGFKSFADEIILEFGRGLTAVVGPNGCGKSNVLDAIIWVLGEQSPGRLRGSEMQDMIFQGSKSRKPLGFASVELTLDNSRDLLPVEYREVTVARKLYRSGESEYYINRNQCRLKDIREMFMDTGIGTRSYSVMEQNNITAIIESSPFERRHIIEEAAGIRKYREKKLEAERSLERTRSDFNEVKNIMAEVQKNIRRLQRQTAKAKKFREGRRRLRYLEVSRLCQEYLKSDKELNFHKESSANLKTQLSALSANKADSEAKIAKLEIERSILEENLLKENRERYAFESDARVITERIEGFTASQQRLDEEIGRVESSLRFNMDSMLALNKDIDGHREKGDGEKDTSIELLAAESEKLLEKKACTDKENEALKASATGIRQKIFLLKKQEIEERKSAEALSERLHRMKVRERELRLAATHSSTELKNKTSSLIEREQKVSKFTGKIADFNNKIKHIDKELSMLEKKREETAATYHAVRSEFDAAKKYLPQLISLEKISERKTPGLRGPISAILEKKLSESDFEKLSRSVGEKLGWMMASDKNTALEVINLLKKDNLPPLTFVIENLLPPPSEDSLKISNSLKKPFDALVSYLLKDVQLVGEEIMIDKCILTGGGESPKKVERMLSLESRIEELREKLSVLENNVDDFRREKQHASNQISDLSSKLENLKDELGRLKGETGRISGHLQYLNKELEDLESEILKIDIGEDTPMNLKQLEDKINNSERELYELEKKLSIGNIESEKLAEKIAEVRGRRAMFEQELAARRDQMKKALLRVENLKKENKTLHVLVGDLKERKKIDDGQHREDVAKISDLKKKQNLILGNISRLDERKAKLLKDIAFLRETLRKTETELNKIKDNFGEKLQSEERLKERISSIRIRLIEDMEIEIEDALKDYSKEPINLEELAQIKKEIEKIGEVNLAAPEEFERENERFNFIKKQLDDLEAADSDIRSIISKINKETKERFQETFNQISDSFSRIFKKLFEGGEAHLTLEDPDNVLESGIEIKVTPEGKNTTSLISVSGGEAALTAISLMFAVYEVKPTPFCILDEVDSSLDDTNLRRFLGMLRKYTDTTQFIIVTHDKQTMQMCDTFYGITMEEFGVSKIISVKLKNAS